MQLQVSLYLSHILGREIKKMLHSLELTKHQLKFFFV